MRIAWRIGRTWAVRWDSRRCTRTRKAGPASAKHWHDGGPTHNTSWCTPGETRTKDAHQECPWPWRWRWRWLTGRVWEKSGRVHVVRHPRLPRSTRHLDQTATWRGHADLRRRIRIRDAELDAPRHRTTRAHETRGLRGLAERGR